MALDPCRLKLPWLADGLTVEQRWGAVCGSAAEMGYTLQRGPLTHRSMFLPWGKLIVADTLWDTLKVRVAVGAHELVHAIDAESYGGGRYLWAARYLACPSARRAAEVLGEAVEAATWAAVTGLSVVDSVSAPNVGGWGPPYFMGGVPDVLRDRIAQLGEMLLESNR